MNIYFYAIIFIIGTLFGSFYTLAVYRIPKGQDITHTHSYCPNCGNKLGFFELIPILSYILLGGKCKKCKQKIRIRYLILEILSGTLFVAFACALKLNIFNLNITDLISFSFIALYLTCVILISCIDKENKNIQKSLLVYGIAISLIYIVYLCIVEKASMYRYAIYLVAIIILLLVDIFKIKKQAINSYTINILTLLLIMLIFTGEITCILTIVGTLIATAICIFTNIIKNRKSKNRKIETSYSLNTRIGFTMGFTNIIVFLLILNLCK